MDPVSEGAKIFRHLAEDFGRTVDDAEKLQAFFRRLHEETRGLVILDFIDTANWDCFEKYEFDPKTRILTLVWHDYSGLHESAQEAEVRRLAFPGEYYALQLKLRSVEIVSGKNLSLFVLTSYVLDEKSIKKKLQNGADDFSVDKEAFFSSVIYRREGTAWQVIRLHTTPISSVVIVPKNCRLTSFDSKTLLYLHNLHTCKDRLSAVEQEFLDQSVSGDDAVCEKANTTRRILETALKIECCYREIVPTKQYSQLLLGDLVSLLKPLCDEDTRKLLNQMVVDLNQMSHDSGHPVEPARARLNNLLAIAYVKMLILEVEIAHRGD